MYFVVPAWRAGIPFFFSVRLKGEFGKRLCDVVRSLVLNIAKMVLLIGAYRILRVGWGMEKWEDRK